MAKMDEAFLEQAPKLEIVFYGAGSVRGFTTEASWKRGVRVVSAWTANGVPVAEYTLATTLFSLKRGWSFARRCREEKTFWRDQPVPGAYRSTVGLVSLGVIARHVCEMMKRFDIHLIAYDPFVSPEEAEALGVELVELDELFRRADVVSIHTPNLPETKKMITGELIGSMKENATLINTARGAVVDEPAMIEVLSRRPDLQAVLDVTFPEPPPPESPLYTLENVVLTPHIAGSVGPECRRMGDYMIAEFDRWIRGEELRYELTEEKVRRMA
jgi:phosphoglycerate dehydrogenase-like enzyme